LPVGRGDRATRATPVSGGGVPIPAGAAAAGDVRLQARADSGRGVSVLAAEYPPTAPSAHCAGVSGALSRDGRDPARAGGPSLHGSGPPGAGDAVLAARRPTAPPALRHPRAAH